MAHHLAKEKLRLEGTETALCDRSGEGMNREWRRKFLIGRAVNKCPLLVRRDGAQTEIVIETSAVAL